MSASARPRRAFMPSAVAEPGRIERIMSQADRQPASHKTIREAKRELSRQLLRHPGVSGVGIEADGDKERIKVYLAEENPALRSLVPATIDGYPVVIEVVGRVVAHAGVPRGDPGATQDTQLQ